MIENLVLTQTKLINDVFSRPTVDYYFKLI